MVALPKNSPSTDSYLMDANPTDDRWWEAQFGLSSTFARTGTAAPAAIIDGTEGDDSLVGTAGEDTINGFGGDDFLDGGSGDDALYGGDGDDWLTGGRNQEGEGDLLDGGAGNDTILAGYGTLIGGAGDDILISGQTSLTGGYIPGNERGASISGDEGNDLIIGTAVDDELEGGEGDDILLAGAGYDNLEGGAGADVLDGGESDNDRAIYSNSTAGVRVDLATGTGHGGDAEGDSLRNIERVRGSSFDDTLIGNDKGVVLDGEDGNDFIRGGAGHDGLYGGYGDDFIEGGADDDHIDPGVGSDTIDGGSGSDTIRILGFYSIPGEEAIQHGGVTVDLAAGTVMRGNFLEDTISNVENVDATTSVADTLIGNASDNTFWGGEGADYIDGGAGVDTVQYSGDSYNERGVVVNLNSGLTMGADAEGDILVGIENILGSPFDYDSLVGTDGANYLSGNTGRDELTGLGGNDRLEDSNGGDYLNGGDGADTFVFASNWNKVSTIEDFHSAEGDKIDLSGFYGHYTNDEPLDLTFVGYGGLSGNAGEVALVIEKTMTTVMIDEDGDGASDFNIWLSSILEPTITEGDFIF
ncbi:hypothetical protein OSJ77_00575 [Phyllobacterium sp. 0TCS1.6C]|uniref:calcium-binding protein n=1 Tax=unclassified Phyllobacterium TaxID=2638441 RepID=UPI00226522FE|nr:MULTISPECIES: hypothetical protein [unclassified Phyllobacterium]MCX8278682.1 hypothetical protein [Phyllobacterium sp. 0TCS1.6C]MCX8293488.1 hypothetical protein [Phyllobacterium sp. 0TCS1.6A]